jgi:hypothetical protein
LADGDLTAWLWFHENTGIFAQQFGLIPGAFGELGLAGAQRRLFLWKLDAILEVLTREQAEREKDKR